MTSIISALLLVFISSLWGGCSSSQIKSHPELLDLGPSSAITSLTEDEWAIEKLKKAGMEAKTIQLLMKPVFSLPKKARSKKNRASRVHSRVQNVIDQVIPLNVLGFIYTGDYSKHDSVDAVPKSLKFLKRYSKTLKMAEKIYAVPKEVITALLWVETKFGKQTGSYPLRQVYVQLLKADHPDEMKKTLLELLQKRPDADLAMQKKAIDRSKTKAAWALEQLQSAVSIYQKQGPWIFKVRSSFAGAFGLPQFIPLSYLQYAKSHVESAHPPHANLYDPRDAILSVANYLHQKGWSPSREDQVKALFEYNRSKDYGAVILLIAGKLLNDTPS